MAQWQIFKGKTTNGSPRQVGELFDDGRIEEPGEAGFDITDMQAEMERRKGDGWSYVGRSTQFHENMAARIDAEVQAIVDDETIPITDPDEARKLVLTDYGINAGA